MARPIDPFKVNELFGKLTTLKELRTCEGEPRQIECRCECGTILVSKFSDLKRGRRTSCGCDKKIPVKKGDRYGSLVVIKEVTSKDKYARTNQTRYIECTCICGTKGAYDLSALRKGKLSCGCLERGVDLDVRKGDIFGKLTIVREVEPDYVREGNRDKKVRRFECKCECGNTSYPILGSLRQGTKSCGCLQREAATTHGMTGSKLHSVWNSMLERCLNRNHAGYHNYGGRGITVCKEWQGSNGFSNFYTDCMSLPKDQQWQPSLDIDRRDNDRGYELTNVHFVTRTDNIRNKRDTVWVEVPVELSDKDFESKKQYTRVNKSGYYEMPLVDLWEISAHKDVSYSVAFKRVVRSGWCAWNAVTTAPIRSVSIHIGDIFGRLKVTKPASDNKYKQKRFSCKCSCGTPVIVLANSLKSGKTKSCGCLADEHRLTAFKSLHRRDNGTFGKLRY